MKLLVLSNYFPEHVGGIETVAANLVARYRRLGHRVRWAAAAPVPHHGHPDDVPLRAWNLAEEHLGFPYPLPGPLSAARLAALARWADALHIHDCLYASGALAFVAARLRRRPVLVTQHVSEVPYSRAALRYLQAAAYRTLGTAILACADQVVFVNDRVRIRFAGLRFRRPPAVIENGIDTDVFHPAAEAERQALRQRLGIPCGGSVLLFVGRFVEKKGIALLRGAATAEPGWTWLFVGRQGDQDPSSWKLANVRVLPPAGQAQLRELYAAADLLVLPSRGEGFPVAVQEAMACGTPALVSSETAASLACITNPLIGAEPEAGAILDCLRSWLPRLSATFRDQVSAFVRDRWSIDSAAGRYEGLLRAMVAA